VLDLNFKPEVADIEPDVHVLRDITNKSTCEGQLKNFEQYFKSRFKQLERILRTRIEMRSATTVKHLKESRPGHELRLIGMVGEARETSWGSTMADIEDYTGSIRVSIKEDYDPKLVKDEVIGIVGKLDRKGEVVHVKNFVRPGIMAIRKGNRSEEDLCAAFIGDIHLGSNTFLDGQWKTFIRWLNGKIEAQRELAAKIKYLVVVGDIVDGIGVYPNQEEELRIRDIYRQYETLAKDLAQIPSHIQMIVLPGNHDAVRPAEPQPTFPKEITCLFPKEIRFVGNPCYFTIHGVEVLAYHGKSLDDLIPALKLTYDRPVESVMETMKEMLLRRHVAPIYGGKTPIAPEAHDHLVIDRVPDIFVTGHLHTTAVNVFNGVLMINSSTWQSQTKFQRMMNLKPDPAKVVVVNLKSMKTNILNFRN
jgi:DNA polymerase II small subunit